MLSGSSHVLRARIRHHLRQVPPETWDEGELGRVLTVLSLISESREIDSGVGGSVVAMSDYRDLRHDATLHGPEGMRLAHIDGTDQ